MFSQPPETSEELIQVKKSTRKARKKQKKKTKRAAAIKNEKSLANTMSSWAENFTMAATWQLKHQVAMWKSKATALEYENQVLRETLRQCYVNGGKNLNQNAVLPISVWNNTVLSDYEQSYMDCEPSASANRDISEESDDNDEGSELELEISEEYMAFLRQNFEYRKARDERKKKEAEEEKRTEMQEIMEPEPPKDRTEEFKELYGDSWQRIAALDCFLSAEFMSLCDSEKPGYWPNIPLRL